MDIAAQRLSLEAITRGSVMIPDSPPTPRTPPPPPAPAPDRPRFISFGASSWKIGNPNLECFMMVDRDDPRMIICKKGDTVLWKTLSRNISKLALFEVDTNRELIMREARLEELWNRKDELGRYTVSAVWIHCFVCKGDYQVDENLPLVEVIYECKNQHSVCRGCYEAYDKCGQCRDPYGQGKLNLISVSDLSHLDQAVFCFQFESSVFHGYKKTYRNLDRTEKEMVTKYVDHMVAAHNFQENLGRITVKLASGKVVRESDLDLLVHQAEAFREHFKAFCTPQAVVSGFMRTGDRSGAFMTITHSLAPL